MTTIEKITFVLNTNSAYDLHNMFITNVIQNMAVSAITDEIQSGTIYTSENRMEAFKAALIISIHNGTI